MASQVVQESCRMVGLVSVAAFLAICGCRQNSSAPPLPESVEASEADEPTPVHGFLGLTFDSVETTPLTIKEPVPGSPAAELGIKDGDLLIGVSGRLNPTFPDIYSVLVNTSPGDRLSIRLSRAGEVFDVELPLLSFDEVQAAMEASNAAPANLK